MGPSIEESFKSTVVLRPTELLQERWPGQLLLPAAVAGGPGRKFRGQLCLTNQRLAAVRESGVFTPTYNVEDVKDLQDIIGVQVLGRGWLARDGIGVQIAWRDPAGTRWWSFALRRQGRQNVTHHYIHRAVREAAQARLESIDAERNASQIQYVLDFSFLRTEMERGGFSLSAAKCPSCGSPVALPDTGSRTECSFCGSTLFAQDLLDRLKSLVEGLK